jgi:hypothetical protein
MFLQKIASLIQIRNHLSTSIDNLLVKLSREEIKAVQAKVQALDKVIVEQSLKLDLNKVFEPNAPVARTFSVSCSDEEFAAATEKVNVLNSTLPLSTEGVADLSKTNALPAQKPSSVKPKAIQKVSDETESE